MTWARSRSGWSGRGTRGGGTAPSSSTAWSPATTAPSPATSRTRPTSWASPRRSPSTCWRKSPPVTASCWALSSAVSCSWWPCWWPWATPPATAGSGARPRCSGGSAPWRRGSCSARARTAPSAAGRPPCSTPCWTTAAAPRKAKAARATPARTRNSG